MKIISNETGETIANILTNHSMTLDEAEVRAIDKQRV